MNAPITLRPIGPISTISQAEKAIRDMELMLRQLLSSITSDIPVGQLKFFALDADGQLSMYTLVDGAGVTLTLNTAAKTCTISAP